MVCCSVAKMSTVLLSLFSLQCYLSLGESELFVIVVLPQTDDTEVSASWERGKEILPGAKQAIEEAKNTFSVTLIEANSGPVTRHDLPYSGNVLEVIVSNLTWQKRASEIIGIAGVLHPNVLAILNQFHVPIISLVDFNKAPHTSNVHYLSAPISTLTDSIQAFLREIRPKKIGLITELNQPYYLMVSDELRTKANTLSLDIQINKQGQSLSSIAFIILESNIHVILLSVGPSTAVAMLCEAYKSGLTWPNYAWILHSYRIEDLLQSSESNEECSVEKILEGVYALQLTKERNESTSKTVLHNDRFNPYAGLLYDSVRSLISTTDNNVSLAGLSHFNPDSSKVYIYHNLNSTVSLTGVYDSTSRTLTKLNVSETIFIDNDLPTITKGLLPPYLLSLPVLSFIFNTILLVLCIVFRNEPSIKSTSVPFSVLMLTGCYLLIVFVMCDIIFDQYRLGLCMLRIWMSAAGLSLPLIIAILLMKMLRVYHIFTTLKLPNQKSIKCKDYALLVYTALILVPQVTLLILRSAISPSRKIEKITEHPGFIEIEQRCDSENSIIWYILTLAYHYIITIVVVVVAIKSRKIRYAHFKDTKKVNLLIVLVFTIGIYHFVYSYAFNYNDPFSFRAKLVIYVCHMLIATVCQVTLFVPKIWPTVREKLCLQMPKRYNSKWLLLTCNK